MPSDIKACLHLPWIPLVGLEGMARLGIVWNERLTLNETIVLFLSFIHARPSYRLKYVFIQSNHTIFDHHHL